MKTSGKIICIGNQKGGVGKSTITSMLANYIQKHSNAKVLVVDADDLQQTLSKLRNKELEVMDQEDDVYNIESIYAADFESNIKSWKANYDLIFVDVPGNLKHAGVGTIYSNTDFLFIPTSSSTFDISSTLEFISFVLEVLKPVNKELITYAFFNRVKPQTKDFKELYKSKDRFPIPFLENFVPEHVNLQREASTVDTYENINSGEYDKFCKEVISILIK